LHSCPALLLQLADMVMILSCIHCSVALCCWRLLGTAAYGRSVGAVYPKKNAWQHTYPKGKIRWSRFYLTDSSKKHKWFAIVNWGCCQSKLIKHTCKLQQFFLCADFVVSVISS
jgi:hypothetical protein